MAEENRKLVFVCSKGNLDMAYPALLIGWTALTEGIDVSIFFTFWGMDLIHQKRIDHLEIPPVGNSSLKMNMMGVPGYIGIPQIMGILPGMTAFATALMKKKMKELKVPTIREYMEMLVDGGAKLYGCKMTWDMYGYKKEDLLPGVIDIVTVSEFLAISEGAQIIFI